MFQHFTQNAITVIGIAQNEARRYGDYVGSGHLLLGLLAVQDGIAFHCLQSSGVTLEAVRSHCADSFFAEGDVSEAESGFSPRTKRILEFAWLEALKLKQDYIATEHLLLGLIRENDGTARKVLTDLEIQIPQLRNAVFGRMTSLALKIAAESPSNMNAVGQAGVLLFLQGRDREAHEFLARAITMDGGNFYIDVEFQCAKRLRAFQ